MLDKVTNKIAVNSIMTDWQSDFTNQDKTSSVPIHCSKQSQEMLLLWRVWWLDHRDCTQGSYEAEGSSV